METDYYSILQLSTEASQDEIKKNVPFLLPCWKKKSKVMFVVVAIRSRSALANTSNSKGETGKTNDNNRSKMSQELPIFVSMITLNSTLPLLFLFYFLWFIQVRSRENIPKYKNLHKRPIYTRAIPIGQVQLSMLKGDFTVKYRKKTV